jgi:sialate O-acetylesterase
VLQRAPQKAVVWGVSKTPGTKVTTAFNGATLTATADATGTWRQVLPPMPASMTTYTISFTSSAGESAALKDVLFGDIFICGGQSNSEWLLKRVKQIVCALLTLLCFQSLWDEVEFAIPAVINKTYEIQRANQYPNIHLMSIGHSTQSATPLPDLQTIWDPWEIASNTTIAQHASPGHTMFSTFSAVCWFFGQRISDEVSGVKTATNPSGGKVPIGLVSDNWVSAMVIGMVSQHLLFLHGLNFSIHDSPSIQCPSIQCPSVHCPSQGGTKVEVWSPPEAFHKCGRNVSGDDRTQTRGGGNMYNAMIHPYTIGPLAFSGFAWFQGEANTRDALSAKLYGCLFPAMIEAWRAAFKQPNLYFGFVQLSTWCAQDVASLPLMREAQMLAARLPNVGWATNADKGDMCNIHPGTVDPQYSTTPY